jgi:hypothetical protein
MISAGMLLNLQLARSASVGLHRLGGRRIRHGAGERGHIKSDAAGHFNKHFRFGDITCFREVGDLDTVEQVPVRRLTTDGFGGLAGKRRFPTVRIVEPGIAHRFDIDQIGPVTDLAADRPMAENGLPGPGGGTPAGSHLRATRLQYEAAMADIKIQLAGQAAHSRGDVETPAADHVVKKIDCQTGGHHATSRTGRSAVRRTASSAT